MLKITKQKNDDSEGQFSSLFEMDRIVWKFLEQKFLFYHISFDFRRAKDKEKNSIKFKLATAEDHVFFVEYKYSIKQANRNEMKIKYLKKGRKKENSDSDIRSII